MRLKRILLVAGLATLAAAVTAVSALCLSSGCGSLGYFAQSVGGHMSLLGAARPVPEWVADSTTPPALRHRLELSQQMRDFAVDALALPDNDSYRRYAELHRGAAVWNVVAAPELSLTLETWCFPVVGCVGYRGYFDRADAEAFAETLRAQGSEVNVYGVPAYSTLGRLPGAYFADPLLSTFINYPEVELARLIFHELAHQVAYRQRRHDVQRVVRDGGGAHRRQALAGRARRSRGRRRVRRVRRPAAGLPRADRAHPRRARGAVQAAPRATPTSAPARPR